MKKITVIFAALILAAATFCSCSNSTPDSTDTSVIDTDLSITEEEINFDLFPVVEAKSSNIDAYRAEVINRLSDDVFVRNSEWEIIERFLPDSGMGEEIVSSNNKYVTTYNYLFDETSRYYYPVVFRETNGTLVLWYTTESGTVLFEGLNCNLHKGNVGGFAHHDYPEGEETLKRVPNFALTYNQETGKVSRWEFGQVVKTYSVPKGSIYCGISTFEGIIFRNGTDVFALQDEECVVIAHDVQFVIDADYYYGSDPWCQPLFLMTDGSLKCYIGWEGNKDIPDDPSHLVDLMYEGSYDK